MPEDPMDLELGNWVEADPEFRTDVEIIPSVPNLSPDLEIGEMPAAPAGPGAEPEDLGAIDEITGIPQAIVESILTCTKYYEDEDKEAREQMNAFYRKAELYWQGLQRIFYDFQATDWKRLDNQDEYDPDMYDKIINIYRAHGESLISALSVKLPNTIFYPDDADVVEDIETAKAYSKIQELIQKHNEGILIFIRALFYLYNHGIAFAHIYNRASSEYGTITVPQYAEMPTTVRSHTAVCPQCMGAIDQKETIDDPTPPYFGEVMACPNCGTIAPPEIQSEEEQIPRIEQYTEEAKSRTIIEVFGPLYVHVALYARKSSDTPYLRQKFEQHKSMLMNLFPKAKDAIGGISSKDFTERQFRTFAGSREELRNNLLTVNCQWLRPWAFDAPLKDSEDKIAAMKKQFPKGCYATIINDRVVDVRDESLDEHWEITQHPTSIHLHADPMGKPLIPIQELRNEAVDLAIETFEHSIPETFADKDVLDFNSYGKETAKAGMVYPVKKPLGSSIGESFHSLKTATLNEEIESFVGRLDSDGQFSVGSFPSIYGGPSESGSKTASEYSQSRAQALQRLNINWTMLKYWWASVMFKSVTQFTNSMVTDEKMVTKTPQSSTGFINIWIKQAELTGRVGRVEPDVDEELPTSYSQIRGTLMELLTLNNEDISSWLMHPQNSSLAAKAMGIPLYIPGADSRDKQMGEIAELLQSPPLGIGMPTIPINAMTDNHNIEAETLLVFLNSPTGQAHKRINPAGIANCEAHYMLHIAEIAKAQQSQMNEEQAIEANSGDTPPPGE